WPLGNAVQALQQSNHLGRRHSGHRVRPPSGHHCPGGRRRSGVPWTRRPRHGGSSSSTVRTCRRQA
ncbi:MAG: hypothetical protein AVDCRST_MAG36-2350, partial [uncultured Nocardioidaceae bacterium]